MARPGKTQRLVVWMNGEVVGTWTVESIGRHAFAYHQDWLASPNARPLSLSLPLRAAALPYRGGAVEAFFDNLLPDNREIRQRIQSRFRTVSTRAFDLLREIGRDCVGAVQLLAEGEAPQDGSRIQGEQLAEADVAAILRAVPTASRDDLDDFRISLAGVQEKTALLRWRGVWHRPLGATPTTHIFKLPLGRIGAFRGGLSASIENEWLSAQILRGYNLDVAEGDIAQFDDQKALIVTRFDRRLSPDRSHWLRLPQEDLCQALALPPSLKYEADGGPGIARIMDLLLGSQQAEHDRLTFFKAQVAFWLLCAPDGHAKNFSVAIRRHGRYQLMPLYDVLSAFPVLGHGAGKLAPEKVKMAMAAMSRNRHYKWAEIRPRHWLATADACGISQAAAQAVIDELVAATPKVIANVAGSLPAGFPAVVSDSIFDGLQTACKRLGDI